MGEALPPVSVDALERLAGSLINHLRSRLELATIEWQEEKLRISRLVLWAALSLFFLELALLMGVLWVVVAWWDTSMRLPVIGAAALAALTAALVGCLMYYRQSRRSERVLMGTVAELRRDAEVLERST